MQTSIRTRTFLLLAGLCTVPLLMLRALGVMQSQGLWLIPPLLVVVFFVAEWISRPVRELAAIAQRMRNGQLHARLAARLPQPWDDIATVMESLADQLDTTLRHLDKEVSERTEALNRKADQLRALGQVGREVAAVLDPASLLHFVVRVMRGTFAYDLVAVMQDEGDHFVLTACAARGVQEVPLGRVYSVRSPDVAFLRDGMKGNGIISHQPIPISDTIRAQTELIVPIRMGTRSIGAMVVQSRQATAFDDDDIFTVRTIAGQVAVALENARLFAAEKHLRSLAITAERNRIAREIHDTLAQSFMGILVHLRALQGAQSAEIAEKHRVQAEMLAQEGLEEARRSVWNLRPERLERRGLAGALQDEIERIQQPGELSAHLEIIGDADSLPPPQAAGVLRITQEALHNVVKHAHARQVHVRLRVGEKDIELDITDDGVGFDAANIVPDKLGSGFGLRGMRERARLLGGDLDIDTAPNAGTKITTRIPLDRGDHV